MNISNYYYYFTGVLTPKFCDEVIQYANAQKEVMARTGGYGDKKLNKDDVKNCMVRIHYEDNRRKGRSWDIELTNNKFIMFPSTCMYYLTNNQKDSLNFVQTILYEYI